jgi:hypothetical protein
MQIELNTGMVNGIFSGTYNTLWEVYDCDDEGNEVEVEYEFNDFMKSILETYQDKKDAILSDLQEVAPFIKDINFINTHSPSEYNFRTDEIDFTLDIDKKAIIRNLPTLKNDYKFKTFLGENYTSYDGFWSFTPNNFEDISDAIINDTDKSDQSISALINYLIGDTDMELQVYEYWRENDYNGLDYKVVKEIE